MVDSWLEMNFNVSKAGCQACLDQRSSDGPSRDYQQPLAQWLATGG
ncbi:MAG: hypothetical protein O3C67_02905 [Cyanobacteria bacterium]|nr:hypothetical protein [Cyanobacteriota bacterium]